MALSVAGSRTLLVVSGSPSRTQILTSHVISPDHRCPIMVMGPYVGATAIALLHACLDIFSGAADSGLVGPRKGGRYSKLMRMAPMRDEQISNRSSIFFSAAALVWAKAVSMMISGSLYLVANVMSAINVTSRLPLGPSAFVVVWVPFRHCKGAGQDLCCCFMCSVKRS